MADTRSVVSDRPLTVVLADEHPIYLIGMASSLKLMARVKIAGQTTRLPSLLELVRDHQPSVIITGYNLQKDEPRRTVRVSVKELAKLSPQSRIVVITSYPSEALCRVLFRAGAHLAINKSCSAVNLIRAVIDDPTRRVPPSRLEFSASAALAAKLSPREILVLRHFLSGMNVGSIAALLHRSGRTISAQKMNAMRKLGVSTVQELVLLSIKSELLP